MTNNPHPRRKRSTNLPSSAAEWILYWGCTASFLCLPFSCWATDEVSAPNPVALLRSAMEGPATAYRGRITVTRSSGKRTRIEKVAVVFAPPNRYRWEFLASDNRRSRIIVSDGDAEQIYIPKQNRIFRGDAIKSYEKLMSEDQETKLLLQNYRISLSGAVKVLGRPSWILDITPRHEGKHSQRLWIDQQTRTILANGRFKSKEEFSVISRFSEFEALQNPSDALFTLHVPSGTHLRDHHLDSGFMSIEDLNQATGKSLRIPSKLPGGFVFESANYFEVGKDTVRHLGYTDGLSTLSIFVTDRSVRLSKRSTVAFPRPIASLKLSSEGSMLRWKSQGQYFTIVGELSEGSFEQIAAFLQKPSNLFSPHP